MCTRILWQGKEGQPVLIGRSLDWFEDVNTNLWALPGGLRRSGLTPAHPLQWTSRYGSLVVDIYGGGTAGGINEAGLDASGLFLAESGYGDRDEALPGLAVSLWAQFYLDNFATVAEAVEHTLASPFQLRPITAGIAERKTIKVHLALADKTGDSAILEFIDGQEKIYHDRAFRVMTNSPPFDRQIEGLRQYKGFGGEAALPGTTKAADRFVRAAYYLQHLPETGDERQAVAGVLSVMRNVSQPFGTADPAEPNTSPTRWRTVADLTNGLYFYEATTSPDIVWIDTRKIDFSPGSGVRKLDPASQSGLIGDVTSRLRPSELFTPLPPDEEKKPAAGAATAG